MKRLTYMGLLVLPALLISCSQKHKMESNISSLEKNLFSGTTESISPEKTDQLVDAYIAFADAYPKDRKAADHLFNAGNIAMNLADPNKAMGIFNRIMKDYPAYEKIPHCLFLKAYIYENELGQLGQAEMLYREFLEKYPGHDFADDAELSLKNLGKTPAELIEEFQKTGTNDSLQ